jgi:NADH-quinone oxidoreductase subunit J
LDVTSHGHRQFGIGGAAVSLAAADLDVAQNVFFGLLAAATVLGAIRVVTTTNVVHAALWLVLVLAGVGANFLLLGAEFVGITQILVYVGAIVVLFLFGTMLTRAPIGKDPTVLNVNWWLGLVVAVPMLGLLTYALIDEWAGDHIGEGVQRTAEVSDSIFQTYLIPFEAIGLLLTAALVGAIVLARKE